MQVGRAADPGQVAALGQLVRHRDRVGRLAPAVEVEDRVEDRSRAPAGRSRAPRSTSTTSAIASLDSIMPPSTHCSASDVLRRRAVERLAWTARGSFPDAPGESTPICASDRLDARRARSPAPDSPAYDRTDSRPDGSDRSPTGRDRTGPPEPRPAAPVGRLWTTWGRLWRRADRLWTDRDCGRPGDIRQSAQ